MFTKNQTSFIKLVEEKFGKEYVISRPEVINIQKENDVGYPAWLMTDTYRVGRGMFKVPSFNFAENDMIMENIVPMKKHTPVENIQENLIPEKDPNFEKFGFYNDLKNIIKSKSLAPIFIFGESGLGKTMMIEQVCAELGREMVKVNFSPETDLVSLVGGPTLVNGNIIFNDGPVVTAMRRGAVLYMDEMAKSHPGNILILNSIIEGKGYYNPHTGENIKPKEGFQIIASSNSNGLGDDSGRYLEQILDHSFLERFPISVVQEYPPERIELKILSKHCADEEFVANLIKWSKVIRKTYEVGATDEMISIRRLVHILKTYNIIKNKKKSIELCVNRFSYETRTSFLDLYVKIDAGIEINENGSIVEENDTNENSL